MVDVDQAPMEGKPLRCRECGAPHEGKQSTCGFCRAPLASLRCGHCYRLNFPEADHCSGCGEHLGLEPVPLAIAHACLECGGPMVVFEDEQAGLWDCDKCQSQFVAHALLQSLIAGRRQWHRVNVPKPEPMALDPVVRYRRCPMCNEWMQRRNFGGTSGVVVDVCAPHGVWFDAWELQQVLSFVEAGGLADMRRAALGLPPPRTVSEQRRSAQAIADALERARQGPPQSDKFPEPELWQVGLERVWSLVVQWLHRAK